MERERTAVGNRTPWGSSCKIAFSRLVSSGDELPPTAHTGAFSGGCVLQNLTKIPRKFLFALYPIYDGCIGFGLSRTFFTVNLIAAS